VNTSNRISLLAGASVPVLYFGAQALAAPFFPNFSVLADTASALGSDRSMHPAILNGGAALAGTAALMASFGLFRELRTHGVWLVVAGLVAACSMSVGLSSLWAASHPLPDPRHNSGLVGAGAFAAPFVALLASLALENSSRLRWYLVVNVLLFFVAAALFAGIIPLDLGLYGGAVQRFAALVMFLPTAVLCIWLLKKAQPNKALADA
jgi:hypothetical membrane protein